MWPHLVNRSYRLNDVALETEGGWRWTRWIHRCRAAAVNGRTPPTQTPSPTVKRVTDLLVYLTTWRGAPLELASVRPGVTGLGLESSWWAYCHGAPLVVLFHLLLLEFMYVCIVLGVAPVAAVQLP